MTGHSQFEKSIEQFLTDLPLALPIEKVAASQPVTCFIAIAGFEARCLGAVDAMAAQQWHSDFGVCVKYTDASMEIPNRKHLDQMAQRIAALTGGTAPLMIEHDDHDLDADFGDKLTQSLAASGIDLQDANAHIVFDITVGSSRLLLEGLHALLNGRASVTLVYSESAKYRPFFEEYLGHIEEQRIHTVEPPEFLTQGVDRVEVLRRIPGQNADARPTFVVMFPSFAFTRSSAVIDELAPSRMQWIFGVPHLVENRWRLDAQKEYHRGLIDKSHRHCYVSTFDYRETLEVLESVFQRRRENYSLFIASLGSKMQKVGQVLFHLLRPEVAAVVSIPRIWNPDRFSSDEPRAVYALQLGKCGDLRKSLWDVRRLRI
jgi:hypothetical protein